MAIYAHWPGGLAAEPGLVRALLAAFERQKPAPRRVATLLIGGTPPPPSPAALARLLGRLGPSPGAAGPGRDALEITLVVAPAAVTTDQLGGFARAGVDRLVLAAGSLDAHAGRLARAARALFPRVGLDLTFARPGQSVPALAAELERAIELGVGHLSLGEVDVEADDRPGERGADHYLHAVEQLTAAGLPPYEVAHFARAGQESRHHLRVATGGALIGIGPGAVGRRRRPGAWWALDSIADPATWLAAVEAGGDGLDQARPLTAVERITELLATGLRLRAGVGRDWFEPQAGCRLEQALPGAALAGLIGDGFLVLDARALRLTARGWPLGDAVLRHLLA